MPGTKMIWKIKSLKGTDEVTWEVFTNPYNKSYIFCHKTKATAWFQYDGVNFCFTHFDGDRRSLLYSFYLAAFRLPMVYISDYISTDSLPVNRAFKGWRLFLHDFTASFFLYLKVNFKVEMKMIGSEFDIDRIEFLSNLSGYSFRRMIWTKGFKLTVNRDNSLKLGDEISEIEALCESY